MSNIPFTVYPAIDLRQGQVVRLRTGDPQQQTAYSSDAGATARRWLDQGAAWLHVVNLDAAFGDSDAANRRALADIVKVAAEYDAAIQMGGGLRSLEALRIAFELGVNRLVLGTALIEQPDLLPAALALWDAEHLAAGLDARQGLLQSRGWTAATSLSAVEFAKTLAEQGLRWLVYTDISRDGVALGANLDETFALRDASGLNVIASGGVNSLEEIRRACQGGLAGVILGRALYEGFLDLRQCLEVCGC
jgi:phosphoribosylformimino-5-aminoimidazole carboxamide ribotide isomerase